MLKKTKIYLDTSVIGGCFDEEFSYWSQLLLSNYQNKSFLLFISTLTKAEISDAPENVKELFFELVETGIEILHETEETLELAEIYINEKILRPNYRDDARHIAIATVYDMDVLVSWNFKHIVHYDKIRRFNAVNLREGYKSIDIYSPREVAHE